MNKNVKPNWSLKIILFFLFYFFNFSLGIARIKIYVNYAYIYGTVLALIGLIYLVIKQRKIKINSGIVWIFLIIQLLTFIFSTFNGTSINGLVNAGHQILFFLIFSSIFYLKNFNTQTYLIFVFDLLVLITSLSLFFAFYGFLFGSFSFGPFIYDSNVKSLFRMQGWYPSPNYLGPALSIGALIIIFKLTNNYIYLLGKKEKLFLTLLLMLHIVGIILTGSKGTYLSFIFGLFVFGIIQKKLLIISIKKIIVFSFVVFAIFLGTEKLFEYLGFNEDVIENKLLRTETIEENLEGGDRLIYWKTSYDILKDSNAFQLFFGNGFGHFQKITGHAAHSGFLEVITGNGIIIFFLSIILLVRTAHASIKNNKIDNIGTIIISLLAMLIVKNLTNNEIPSNNFSGIVYVIILTIVSFKSVGNNINSSLK